MSGDHNMYQKPSIKVDGVDLVAEVETLKRLLLQAQKKEWQGLTDEEVKTAWSQLWYDLNNGKFAASDDPSRHNTVMFARAIEAKLKEKNR